jgi:DNA processing protein
LAYGLAERGWTVVSGSAYGVDASAHRGALTTGGPTVAFLGSGIDVVSPASHESLFELICKNGLLVSEWPPGPGGMSYRFAWANRLIAAASRGVVMVEAAIHSEALRTLGHAVALGRPAMAVPGQVTSRLSAGCHRFLRQNPAGRLVTDAAQVISVIEEKVLVETKPGARQPRAAT